ncbi:hypothetical protein IU459_27110 [Nocardia amamiensis]|uniref:Acb2/Tad1 hairpin domain-containing protein n=1 Tax=Nocardia amamiensis TaxID=404578 RepID=A0ABS0CX66_9NOCA|nr:hypothetical protein [Nocardia amamiensis]MBF6301186.1 hypothetical protein [Nocardia amamiensis]
MTSYHDPNSTDDIDNRFNYHPASGDKVTAHEQTRAACRELAHRFDRELPPGREKALALTKLEETMFWANAAIARAKN